MKHLLEITAQLKRITEMEPLGGSDDEDMSYFFTLKCKECDNITPEQCCYMSGAFYHGGKKVNHVATCYGCDREGTVKLIPGHGSKFTATDAIEGDYTPLMMFECEGLVPKDYLFNGGWKLTTESGQEIKVNLVGGKIKGPRDENGRRLYSVKAARGRFKVHRE